MTSIANFMDAHGINVQITLLPRDREAQDEE